MSAARYPIVCGLAAWVLVATGCGSDKTETASFTAEAPPPGMTITEEEPPPSSPERKPEVTVPKGPPPAKLVIEDLEKGTGKTAGAGDDVSIDYVGVAYSTKREFDSSFAVGMPFDFTLGKGTVIVGWERGIEGMKVGGRRQLIIPPDIAYGAEGAPPSINPNETLIFVVDLIAVE